MKIKNLNIKVLIFATIKGIFQIMKKTLKIASNNDNLLIVIM